MRKNALFFALIFLPHCVFTKIPKLMLIIVIDQFAYHELQKNKSLLQGGIKSLCNDGVVFTNAYQEHGAPVTAVGHAALATGAWPYDHGIVNNSWVDYRGKKIHCDVDDSPAAAPLNKFSHETGASAHYLMVDTLADQIVLTNPEQFDVYSVSLKRRAAIMMAGRLGKALWFDDHEGAFTSSKAYFSALPEWINVYKTESIKNDKKDFFASPQASKLFLDFVAYLIKYQLKNSSKNLVLWLNISNLDRIGHHYGPQDEKTIEILKAIDEQLNEFFNNVFAVVDKAETCIVLTADHGVEPLPEKSRQQGLDFAQRINKKSLIKSINNYVAEHFGIEGFVQHCQLPFLYLNNEIVHEMPLPYQNLVISAIKSFLESIPGVRQVWTAEELQWQTFEPHSINNFLKNQQYPGRSGQLIMKVMPYVLVTDYETGTKHNTPYEYNTHVPLILYQPGIYEHKVISQRVNTRQVAPTLANILEVPRPSACTENALLN